MEMIAWLREAWQRGLITEASIETDRAGMMACYQNQTALMSFWPRLGIAGYELAPVEDMEVVSYGCDPKGSLDAYVGIGADVSDPFRILEFVDWLYSAEGIMISGTGTGLKAAGPEGLTWEVESGNPVLADFGRKAFAWQTQQDALTTAELQMPEEWGRGSWYQGSSRLSLQPVTEVEVTPSGFSYNYALWDTTMERYTDAPASWQERMDAFADMEYLIRNNKLSILPGYKEKEQKDPEDIAAQRKACREVIADYSLQIIRADSEEECGELFEKMCKEAFLAGYEDVVDYDRTAE
jgi:multiple sugar transport system substrate-binding protein/putative aldouronate transport system substrate-binding protein